MDKVEVIEGWRHVFGEYACRLRITLDGEPTDFVPAATDWYAVAEATYPRGDLTLYPSKQGGITATFPHQTYNGAGDGTEWGKLPWRPGYPCLDHPLTRLGLGTAREPTDATDRLAWQVTRLRRWLSAATTNLLQAPGDPFELPQAPDIESGHDLIFVESDGGLEVWDGVEVRQGLVDLLPFGRNPDRLRPIIFRDEQDRELRRINWNNVETKALASSRKGLWLRLDRVPVQAPWRLPLNWEELASDCLSAGTNLGELLDRHSRRLRDGKRHPLLIGYPIPEVVGGPSKRLHWSAVLLPELSNAKSATKKGYKGRVEASLLTCDKHHVRHGKMPLSWIASSNWADDQVRSRGRLSDNIAESKIILIGAGALGSMVAELLARAGAIITAILDPENLAAGNTCRHILTLEDVGVGKAAAMAARIKEIQPFSNCQGIGMAFPPRDAKFRSVLDDADVVIDCTGDNVVLGALRDYPWPRRRHFISLSLGWRGARLYAFGCRSPYFPADVFQEEYGPWKNVESEARSGEDMPWEGIGCWHPVFPARADHIAMGAALGIQFIENIMHGDCENRFEAFDLGLDAFRRAVQTV